MTDCNGLPELLTFGGGAIVFLLWWWDYRREMRGYNGG
jgi:hypothetical protein